MVIFFPVSYNQRHPIRANQTRCRRAMTERDRAKPACPNPGRGGGIARFGPAGALLALALVGGAARSAAEDGTLGIMPWLPSDGPPQSQTLERQRTDVYRDRLNAETRLFELRGDATDHRALDRNRSLQRELDRLRTVAPPGVARPGVARPGVK